MKRTLIIAALAASIAAPAFADNAFTVQRLNQDFDSIGDIRAVPSPDSFVAVSTSGMSPLGTAFDVLNGSQDSASDIRGANGATVVRNNTSGVAADIFARLRAESLEDE